MTYTTDVVELTQQLVRIRSVNPPGNEEECARWLAAYLDSFGFVTKLTTFGQGRFNLVADYAGQGSGKVLAFSGHLDTVPLGSAAWSVDPFSAEIRDGRLYGRGATDMKSGIAAFLIACIQSRDTLQGTAGVRLLLTGGEETGCDGARALTKSTPGYLKDVGALIVGEPTRNYPFIGHKGALWLKGSAAGVTAHGAMPEAGVNAIYKVVEAINKLRAFDLDHRHPLMGTASMNVGTIHGGLNVNNVPDQAAFEVDFRTVPGMEHESIQTDLIELLGEQVELAPFVDVPPLENDVLDPWLQRVFRCCSLFVGAIEPKVVPYFTDGSVLAPPARDFPVVVLGPGEPQMMHKTDEYCRIDRLLEGVEVYRKLLLDWASPQGSFGETAERGVSLPK